MYCLLPVLKLLLTLQFEDDSFVCANVYAFLYDLILSLGPLWECVSGRFGRLQYYTRKVKDFSLVNYGYDDPQVHPSTYVRIAQLQSSALFPSLRRFHCFMEDSHISYIILFQSPLLDSISLSNIDGYENTVVGPFLATLSRTPQMLSRIVLDSGRMSVDILKKYFVHLKQLRAILVYGKSLACYRYLETLLWRLAILYLIPRTLLRIQPEWRSQVF